MIIVLIGAAIALAACGAPDSPTAANQTEHAPETAAESGPETQPAAAQQDDHDDGVVVIEMHAAAGRNYNDPIGIHVEPGTTIRFVNATGMHSATTYHPDNGRDLRIPPDAESWDSGLITRRNSTFEVTLTVEGVYDYYCVPHEAMGHVGRIIVGDPDASPASPTDGLMAAVRNALPSVERIMAEHIVRP
ncbi:MAG: hypothetical protein EA426_16730 [Spirochaetaceae bacterium]|nr:MAG: hypothetical protein EA426_16730 [Spirochaetaceae bacterium]